MKGSMIIIGVLCAQGIQAQTLSLKEYLSLQLKEHYQIWQQQAQQASQRLALDVGLEYWKPSLTATSGWEESKDVSDSSDTTYDQWNVGLETSWTSDIGTEVSVNVKREDGEGLNSLADQQYNHSISMTLSQPLLKENTVSYNRLKRRQAENVWQEFINDGHLTRLKVQRDSLSAFVDYQLAYENWLVQKELLESLEKSRLLVERMFEVDKATPYELNQARLQVQEQQSQVEGAFLEMNTSQSEAVLTLEREEMYSLAPFVSLEALNQMLWQANQSGGRDVSLPEHSHPEWIEAQLSYESAKLDYEEQASNLKPDLNLFYEYEKNDYQKTANTESSTYGIRFSYLITNKSVEQELKALSAEMDVSLIEQKHVSRTLLLRLDNYRKQVNHLRNLVRVSSQQVALARQGVAQQFKRYQVGKVSYFSLEEVQQDLLDKQEDWLSAENDLATALIQLAYYQQTDIRSRL